MLISILKSQKTSDNLGNLYIHNKKKSEIRMNILRLVSYDFQKVNKSSTKRTISI